MKKFNYVKISPINGIALYVHVYESIIGVPEAMKIYRSQIATVYIYICVCIYTVRCTKFKERDTHYECRQLCKQMVMCAALL